jgi:glutathione S-transferase
MKLLATTTSPFARKVLMLVRERGLADRITFVPTDLAGEALAKENPLNKVPALILDDGASLFDSPVVCEYLDHVGSAPPLFPAPGPARWRALREQALADGMCDAAVLRMQETTRRPPELRWPDWITRQRRKLVQGLDELERAKAGAALPAAGAPVTIGDLSVLSALGYLDFRFPDDPWRDGRPHLVAWFDRVSDRDSFRATVPKA